MIDPDLQLIRAASQVDLVWCPRTLRSSVDKVILFAHFTFCPLRFARLLLIEDLQILLHALLENLSRFGNRSKTHHKPDHQQVELHNIRPILPSPVSRSLERHRLIGKFCEDVLIARCSLMRFGPSKNHGPVSSGAPAKPERGGGEHHHGRSDDKGADAKSCLVDLLDIHPEDRGSEADGDEEEGEDGHW
jgi:hypothetical protein